MVGLVALSSCGGDVPASPEVTATDAGSDARSEPSTSEEPESEGRDPEALYGVDVCTALLPALDDRMEGLDRYATSEVLRVLAEASDEPVARFAEVFVESEGTCTIALGDYWVQLTLVGDGHVGHRAAEAIEHNSYEDGGDVSFDEDAVATAVEAYRTDPAACEGNAATLDEEMVDHVTFDLEGGTVVAVVCDVFAYQSSYELLGWDGHGLLALDVEQWRDGIVHSPMLLGYPGLDSEGRMDNLEKARGSGDCGTWSRWVLEDGLRLLEARVRGCDDSSPHVEPQQWPLVYTR